MKNANLNNVRQYNTRTDRYHPVQVIQGVSGYLDKCTRFHSKPPKCSLFSGEEVAKKQEISVNRWLYEVRTIQKSYAEPLIREAIIRSVIGWAAYIVCLLGTNTDVEKNISKLEMAYGTVSGYDVLMQEFYGVHVEKK